MLKQKVIYTLILISLGLISCEPKTSKENTETTTEKSEDSSMKIFENKVIVFLSKEPDPNSNVLDLQDFIEEGKSFIPVFTSQEKLTESIQGAELPYSQIKIDGMFLLSIMKGDETIRVNPTLNDEAYFISADLKDHYKQEIEVLVKEMAQAIDSTRH